MFNADRGFGFIVPDGPGENVFFHVTVLRDGEEIAPGVAVTFETGVDPKSGRTRATTVDLT